MYTIINSATVSCFKKIKEIPGLLDRQTDRQNAIRNKYKYGIGKNIKILEKTAKFVA
jgi:hypothetical protein